MKLTSRMTSMSMLIFMAGMLILSGCSQDNPISPATGIDGDVSYRGSQSLSLAEDVNETILSKVEPTFVETFDNGSNVGNWSFFGNPNNGIEVIEADGGRPGAFLHSTWDPYYALESFAPKFRTQLGVSSIFTGDYRGKKVIEVGVDLATFGPDFVTTLGRPLSLILCNDNKTPTDLRDDLLVAYKGHPNIPIANGNFRPYKFDIPSQSTVLPEGWQILRGSGDSDADWNQTISNVTQVIYYYGDPTLYFILQQWELGVDNVSITMADE